jgi:hypothetical protein
MPVKRLRRPRTSGRVWPGDRVKELLRWFGQWGVFCAPRRDGQSVVAGRLGAAVRVVATSVASGVLLTGVGEARASGWSVQPVPLPAVANGQLLAVSCESSRACTAVGYFTDSAMVEVPLAEVWNGSGWSIQRPGTPVGAAASRLTGVSCKSKRACIAVGYLTASGGGRRMLAEVWDGVAWNVQSAPTPIGATASSFNGMSCSFSICTVVGWYTDRAGDRVALAERWSGSRWSIQRVPSPVGARRTSFSGVSCTSGRVCVAVGFASRRGPLI